MFLLISPAEWLTGEKSLAVATWGLVIATLFLYLDSRAKGKEQAERWRREDSLRNEAAKPRAVVELGKRENTPHVVALCYNLGEHPFVIDKLIVVTAVTQKSSTRVSDLLGPYVVAPSTYVPVTVDCSDLLHGTGLHDASVTLQLIGAFGTLSTEPVLFSFYPDPPTGYGWSLGGPAERLPGMIVRQPRMIPTGSRE
jgi:hypothetical protein